jgi:hypothetical protein
MESHPVSRPLQNPIDVFNANLRYFFYSVTSLSVEMNRSNAGIEPERSAQIVAGRDEAGWPGIQ